jgi:predicted secreted Zn-dependent protease
MLRVVLMAISSLLISGCNIEITVPAGGHITTTSGLYACAAGEHCELSVDHPYFAESFTATPEPGYVFSHWQDRAGAFCAGQRQAVCTLPPTSIFLQRPELAPWLAVEATYTLSPVFLALNTVPAAADAAWQLQSSHRVVNYQIDGDSADQILASLRSDANPLPISANTGTRVIGYSVTTAAREYSAEGDSADQHCKIVSGMVTATYTTTLPQLLQPELKTAAIQSSWNRFYQDLEQHEAGHQQINRSYYLELSRRYGAVVGRPCDELPAALAEVKAAWVEELAAAHDQYHTDTGASTSFSDYF